MTRLCLLSPLGFPHDPLKDRLGDRFGQVQDLGFADSPFRGDAAAFSYTTLGLRRTPSFTG